MTLFGSKNHPDPGKFRWQPVGGRAFEREDRRDLRRIPDFLLSDEPRPTGCEIAE